MKIRRKKPHDEELEFQIAPMVDVLLVIMIFFVTITSASVLRLNVNLHLPVAVNAEKMVKTMQEVLVNAIWDPKTGKGSASTVAPTGGSLEFVDMNLLTNFLKPLVKGDRFRVVIRADRDAPAWFVQRVVASCAAAGIDDVTFAAVNTDK